MDRLAQGALKVLLLSWNFPPVIGGIEIVAAKLFAGLQTRAPGSKALVAYAENPTPLPQVERAGKPGLKAFNLFALRRGHALCRSEKFDLIVCSSLSSAPAAWLLSKWHRVPYVLLVHGSDVLRPGFFYQRFARFLVRGARRLCANSQNTANILIGLRLPESRIQVVYPGVDVKEFSDPPPPDPQSEIASLIGEAQIAHRSIVLSVGRLIRRKGILEFVRDVMPRLRETCPDVLYLVVGDDASDSLMHHERLRDAIRAEIDRQDLKEHVRMLGRVGGDDLKRLLFAADLFLLPGLDISGDVEGFGIVFCEAALAGAPSVATRAGGMVEAVVDGETGLLAEPGQADDLHEKVSRLLQDTELRRRLGRQAARRARDEFSWEVICDQYAGVFKNAINQ